MKMQMLNFARDSAGRDVGIRATDSHSVLIGEPGSGKTVALNSLILEMLREPSVGVCVIDPKQMSFRAFDDERLSGRVRVYRDPSTFSNVFEGLFQEHVRRTAIFQDMGVEELPPELSRVYVVVDELPALVSDSSVIGKEARNSISSNMLRLLRMSRQTGILLVCASQSAEGSNLISANARGLYSNRVLFKCSNASEAEMAFNSKSASELNLDNLQPGECYIKTGSLDLFRAWAKQVKDDGLRQRIAEVPQSDVDFEFLEKRGL